MPTAMCMSSVVLVEDGVEGGWRQPEEAHQEEQGWSSHGTNSASTCTLCSRGGLLVAFLHFGWPASCSFFVFVVM